MCIKNIQLLYYLAYNLKPFKQLKVLVNADNTLTNIAYSQNTT